MNSSFQVVNAVFVGLSRKTKGTWNMKVSENGKTIIAYWLFNLKPWELTSNQ